MAGVRISALPAMVHMDLTNLLPMVDELATPTIQTQKVTIQQLIDFLKTQMALSYLCTTDPNVETVGAFRGSVCVGTGNGSIWSNQGTGFNNNGWVQLA